MTWNDITVRQWQAYARLMNGIDLQHIGAIELVELNEKLVSIMYDLPLSKIEIMSEGDFAKKVNDLSFLNSPLAEGKPKNRIKVNGQVYRLKYDVRKHTHSRHIAMFANAGDVISVKEFSRDFVDNIGKIIATIVVPQRKILGLYFDKKIKPQDHELISERILDAKFMDIYPACIFFCKLFEKLIQASLTYLASRKELTPQTRASLTHSLTNMDGFIRQNKWHYITE